MSVHYPATAGEALRRVRLRHHEIVLQDGHLVGVTLGGRGIPLVFLHGLAMNRRTYTRMLSRVAGLGFMVIAFDAAGHGDTHELPRGEDDFASRADLTLRALDALGVNHAIIAGHSLGGRTAIRLAAHAPDRFLAAVLFAPAAGALFDDSIPSLLQSPAVAVRTLLGLAVDLHSEPLRLRVSDRGRYGRMLAKVALSVGRRPGGPTAALLAMMRSGDYSSLLHTLRDHRVPTFVLHGEKDQLVPFVNARDIAECADATLYRVPGAYHLWMIADPRHGAAALQHLLNGELAAVLRNAAHQWGIDDWRDPLSWDRALIGDDGWVRDLVGGKASDLGYEPIEHIDLELVRSSAIFQLR